jgi:catechol 2,3-dioxygenase-like lactoylglutathione lyase family enzyme
MLLLDHVSISVRDLPVAAPFYDAVMSVLGAAAVYRRADAIGYGLRNRPGDDRHSYLTVRATAGDTSAFADEARHWCFRAPDRAAVDAFFAAGLHAGGIDAGAPGLRPHYHASYYAAFLLDPSGNKLEAACHTAE